MTTDNHVKTMLLDALDDERKAEATYRAIIAKFGPIPPFTNIVQAEARHAAAIEREMKRFDLEIPVDRWKGMTDAPETLAAACQLAVEAEIENIALFDRLIPQIGDASLRQVFQNLQDASRNNHLPAFQRCLARENGEKGSHSAGQGRNRSGHGRGCGS